MTEAPSTAAAVPQRARRRIVVQVVRLAARPVLLALGKTASRKTVHRTVFRSLTPLGRRSKRRRRLITYRSQGKRITYCAQGAQITYHPRGGWITYRPRRGRITYTASPRLHTDRGAIGLHTTPRGGVDLETTDYIPSRERLGFGNDGYGRRKTERGLSLFATVPAPFIRFPRLLVCLPCFRRLSSDCGSPLRCDPCVR